MIDELFIISLIAVFAIVFMWCFKVLPQEKWQIIASIPKRKQLTGQWVGENLTYYGFFNANAYVFGVITVIVLLGSLNIQLLFIFTITCLVLILCVPASRIVAKIVEKKAYTFTVGGASFVGIITTPWIIWLVSICLDNNISSKIGILTVLSAISIGYTFGEGLGRLACISFGCCYGKPLYRCHPYLQKLFNSRCFIFSGHTKKIAYADQLDEEKVLPIQAITSLLYCLSGTIGVYLFLKGFYISAFLETLIITQIWRLLSEFFRADYRGKGKISAYQIMGIIAVFYSIFILFIFPASNIQKPNLLNGFSYLWNPGMIIFLQALWLIIFLYTGKSSVTGSFVSFYVVKDKI